MKNSLTIFLGAVLLISGCAPYYYGAPGPYYGPTANVVVAAEDQPYYVRGPYYVEHGRRWVWVGGHWGHRHGHRVWIHGHYIVRG